MRWVEATRPDGKKCHVNLDAIPSMDRNGAKIDDKDVTLLFLGGIAISVQGNVSYASTAVLETPVELISLPEISPEIASNVAQLEAGRRKKKKA